MRELTKAEVKKELVIQNALFENLKKWLVLAMCLSSLFFSATLLWKQYSIVYWTAIVLMTVSVIASIIIGLAVKRGHDNLNKLVLLLDQKD